MNAPHSARDNRSSGALSQPSSSSVGRLLNPSPAFAAFIAMLLCGSWHITKPALWADELATDGAARLSWGSLFKLVSHVDQVLAPYYLVMHVWTRIFGFSEFSERFPSLIAMSVAAALTSKLATRFWGATAGCFAALLFVAIPATSRFAQEARPYAFSVMFICLAFWAITGLPTTSHRNRLELTVILSILGAGLTQPVSLLAVPALFFGWNVFRGPSHTYMRRRFVALSALACLPAACLFIYGWMVQSNVWSWITPQPWENGPMRVTSVYLGSEVGGAVLILGLASLRRRRVEIMLFLWGYLPVVLLFVVGMKLPIFTGRLLEFTVPGVVLLGSCTLLRVNRAAAMAALMAVSLFGAPAQMAIRGQAGHSQDSRLVQRTIEKEFHPGDVAVYGNLPHSISWSPRDTVRYYVSAHKVPRDVLAQRAQRVDGHFLAELCPSASTCLDSPARIWVIRNDRTADVRASLPGDVSPVLLGRYAVAQRWDSAGITVALLTRKA